MRDPNLAPPLAVPTLHLPCQKEMARLQSQRDDAERLAVSLRNVLREVRNRALSVAGVSIEPDLAKKIDRALAGELA